MRMRRAALIIVLLGGVLLAGCHRALFPKAEPRTQFEVYDRMRSGYVPLEEPDVFGMPQPALRNRLTPPQ
jgi:hypothetical protein